jgi:hypothetical protein
MCEIYAGDYDAPSVWRESWQRARKPYKCETCNNAIETGSRYKRVFYVFEGDAHEEFACELCSDDAEAFSNAHNFGPYPSSFLEILSECIAEGDEESDRVWSPMLERINDRRAAA